MEAAESLAVVGGAGSWKNDHLIEGSTVSTLGALGVRLAANPLPLVRRRARVLALRRASAPGRGRRCGAYLEQSISPGSPAFPRAPLWPALEPEAFQRGVAAPPLAEWLRTQLGTRAADCARPRRRPLGRCLVRLTDSRPRPSGGCRAARASTSSVVPSPPRQLLDGAHRRILPSGRGSVLGSPRRQKKSANSRTIYSTRSAGTSGSRARLFIAARTAGNPFFASSSFVERSRTSGSLAQSPRHAGRTRPGWNARGSCHRRSRECSQRASTYFRDNPLRCSVDVALYRSTI